MSATKATKVRIAPSPTGFLHIGTAQSALYNWLFAKKSGGEFHLRIEDTDKARSTKEYEESIIDALTWLDLKWDGDISRSSDNQPRYRELLERLLQEGKAFYCHHTQEELETERKAQEAAKEPPRHVCEHKHTEKGKEPGGIIRLKVDETSDRTVSFQDVIRGKVEFKQSLLGDFSIARSLDDALYHFAVVVDDVDMDITHVLRGEDHLSNTPKHLLIFEALELTPPAFAHLPLILAPDRSKLSKRHGVVSVVDYKKDYLPEAIINFIGGLSYTFSKDIISKEEMVEEFELSKVHKSGAVFDIKKLNWINAQYIKRLSPAEFKKVANLPDIPDAAVPLITERLERLSDAQEFAYLWEEPTYPKELLLWKTSSFEEVKNSLAKTLAVIQNLEEVTDPSLRNELESLSVDTSNKGLVFWPLRAALSGKEKSPDPVQIAVVLGKEETAKRIEKALQSLS